MRIYELVIVLRPSLKDADKKKLLETVKGWLKDLKVTKEEAWGQKPLAYPIKKQVAGDYHQWILEGEAIPAGFETRLLQTENVLRHLLLRTK